MDRAAANVTGHAPRRISGPSFCAATRRSESLCNRMADGARNLGACHGLERGSRPRRCPALHRAPRAGSRCQGCPPMLPRAALWIGPARGHVEQKVTAGDWLAIRPAMGLAGLLAPQVATQFRSAHNVCGVGVVSGIEARLHAFERMARHCGRQAIICVQARLHSWQVFVPGASGESCGRACPRGEVAGKRPWSIAPGSQSLKSTRTAPYQCPRPIGSTMPKLSGLPMIAKWRDLPRRRPVRADGSGKLPPERATQFCLYMPWGRLAATLG